MKGKSNLLIGVGVLLVAGIVVIAKVAGSGDEDADDRTGKNGVARTGTQGSASGARSTKSKDRPAGTGTRRGGQRGRVVPRAESKLSAPEASKQARAWIDDARRKDDPEKRREAIIAVEVALEGKDELAILSGLQACPGIANEGIDPGQFRRLVKRHLDAADPAIRRAAWFALVAIERQPEDLARLRELAHDPSANVRGSISHLMLAYEDGQLTGESGRTIVGMLNAEDLPVRRDILRGMNGAAISPELEAKVIELSRSNEPSEVFDVVHHVLSTQTNKSVESVDRLIEIMGISGSSNEIRTAGRAAWGLRSGIPEEAKPQIAEAALGLLEEEKGGKLWSYGIDLLGRYGTETNRPEIETLLSDPNLDSRSRMSLQAVLQRLK